MSSTTKQDVAVTTSNEAPLPSVLANPFEEMERTFERLMQRDWLRPFKWDWPLANTMAEGLNLRCPAVDVIDQNERVVVRAELPGIDKKDIDVSMTENTMTIRGKARSEKKEEHGDYYRSEISQSAFSRTVALPSSIDPAKVKAKLQDGILEVIVEKSNGSRRRPITIE